MLMYMIVYPRGDRGRLALGSMRDYEKSHWALASQREFDYTPEGEAEARDYMKELGERHGLDYEGKTLD
jgi:hypothetical protein